MGRFTLYIKKAGTCPFSQRAYMFLLLHVPGSEITVEEVDFKNKTEAFLKLNPDGKVPVLVDHAPAEGPSPKVVPDSAEIVKYIETSCPGDKSHDTKCGDEDEASTFGQLFGLFAKYLKNKDPSADEGNKKALLEGFEKLDGYLKNHGKKYLLGDHLTEPDCMLLPRLNQIRAAGEELKNFHIPDKYNHVWKYMNAAKEEAAWKQTCPKDKDICDGWKIHL